MLHLCVPEYVPNGINKRNIEMMKCFIPKSISVASSEFRYLDGPEQQPGEPRREPKQV